MIAIKENIRILLGNTGRGGELCLFTSIIKAYRTRFPKAEILIATCPQYESLFENNKDIDQWLKIDIKNKERPHLYNNPIVAWQELIKQTKADVIEFTCEYDFSPSAKPGQRTKWSQNSSLLNCFLRIKQPFFEYDQIPRYVFIYPTEYEHRLAKMITNAYKDIILISHVAHSADPVLAPEEFGLLGEFLSDYGTVCYTGQHKDPELEHLKDLRGISYGTLHALAPHLKIFVSPDTATPFIVSHMPGKLITLRRDKKFPLSNTGLQLMGYRKPDNTLELEAGEMSRQDIYDTVVNAAD